MILINKSKAYRDMMKNERLMKKVKKYWKQLKFYSKFMNKKSQAEIEKEEKNEFLKKAIMNEEDEEDFEEVDENIK